MFDWAQFVSDLLPLVSRVIALFHITTDVVNNTQDHGVQSVAKAVLTTVNDQVASGHLPASMTEHIDDVLPVILAVHPGVKNAPDTGNPAVDGTHLLPTLAEVKAATAAPGTAVPPPAFDYDLLAAAILRAQKKGV